jgi:transposase
LWLTNPRKWTNEQKGLFKKLKNKKLVVGRAWMLKEMFSGLWQYTYETADRNLFRKWYRWATHSCLKPVTEVANLLKRHLDNILTYLKHGITNAITESLNSKIQ